MTVSRNADFETYFLVDDQKVRESFQQVFDNTSNIQAQFDLLLSLVLNAADLAALQTAIQINFPDAT
jgi:hypothetical protein